MAAITKNALTPMNSKRRFIRACAAASTLAAFGASALAQADAPIALNVWKSPSCGCCADWVKHLKHNGFKVTVHDTGNTAARARLGIPASFGSCHTGSVAGYAIEGHVPAREIHKLLAQRPTAVGLAVPQMPAGSPGMEQGDSRDPYDVLLVTRDGRASVFASYGK